MVDFKNDDSLNQEMSSEEKIGTKEKILSNGSQKTSDTSNEQVPLSLSLEEIEKEVIKDFSCFEFDMDILVNETFCSIKKIKETGPFF